MNAIELIRVSTKAQAKEDRGGIPAQRAACKAIAERHALNLKWSIEMTDVSGAAVMYSPEIKKLTQILKSGECSGVVMKEHTRLMRPENFEDYAILQLFKDHKVKIYAPDDVMDLSNPSGQLMGVIKFGMSGYERATIMERCSAARHEMRVAGKCPSAAHTLPYALLYDRKHESWSWDESKASQVERLFDLFTSGTSAYSALSRETGISYHSIRDTLSNPVYTGVRVYGEKYQRTGVYRNGHEVTRKVKVAADQVVKTTLPCGGIVSKDVFAQAQKILSIKAEMKWHHKRDVSADPYAFRGMLKCGDCGLPLITFTHKAGGTSRDYYVCRGVHGDRGKWDADKEAYTWRIKNSTCRTARIRRDRVEPMLDELIGKKLSDADFVFGLLEAYRASVEENDNKGAAVRLNKELTNVTEKLERLKTLFVDGDLSRFEYEARKKKVEAQAAAVQVELGKITPDVPKVSPETLERIVAPFAQWRYLDKADRRALLTTVVPIIRVTGVSNGGRGAGAKTEIRIDGFYLTLTGDDVMPEDGAGGLQIIRKRGGDRRSTRVNTGKSQLVQGLVRSSMEQSKHQLVYIPLSA